MPRRALHHLIGLLVWMAVILGGAATAQAPVATDLPSSSVPGVGTGVARLKHVPASAAARRGIRVLSNGCSYGPRGMPDCGALLGAAYGANSAPLPWERTMGHRLGVRRTYWAADQVDVAVRTARIDLAHERVPWMSFKLPYSWASMAAGRGDGWARHLARRMSHLDGPVWLAFHHEPEGDGDIRQWTRMQARLAPIVRSAAANVAYSVVVTGWNQLYGPHKYSLSSLLPRHTKIDLLGFDVYDKYGVAKDGRRFTSHTDFVSSYFSEFQRFAQEHGMRWGLAETGQTDLSALHDPHWVARTYREMRDHGGIAFCYFNTRLNSVAPWVLHGGAKSGGFTEALRTSPTL
jgi:hypothetical protein